MPRFFDPYLQLFLTVALITAGEIFLKHGAVSTPASAGDWLGLSSLGSKPVWIGTALLIVSSITWIFVLRAMPLYLAFMLGSVIHVTIPICSWWLLGERLSLTRWGGIALVLAGICVIAKDAGRIEERR